MKKRRIIICIAFVLIVAVVLGRMGYAYYGTAPELSPYTCSQHKDDTLRILFIGDSWAYMHQRHDAELAAMLSAKSSRPVSVCSYGICGITSKGFYESLFQDDSLRSLLSHGADYAIVSIGINDSYQKRGATHYALHTIYILRFLIANNIHPILLEIPDYDIVYAYEHQTFSRKGLRQLSMLLTGSQIDCREAYRQALRAKLYQNQLLNKVRLLSLESWDYDLYLSDRMHLNEKGYATLDSMIAKSSFINF